MAKIVKCPTERENGGRCDFELQPVFVVCPICSQHVDPEWFKESPSPDTNGKFLLICMPKNNVPYNICMYI